MIAVPKLSVIIPVFNSELFLSATIKSLFEWRGTRSSEIEIYFINDGSTDGTEVILTHSAVGNNIFVIPQSKNMGKGASVRLGFQKARGELVAFTDADLPYGLTGIDSMVSAMNANNTLGFLYGSRAHTQSVVRRGYGLLRRLGRTFFSTAVRVVLPIKSADTQCGLKICRRPLVNAVARLSHLNRFAFDMELFIIAQENNILTASFPVELSHRKESTVHIVLDTFRMLIDMLRVRFRLMRGSYKLPVH